MEIHIVQPGETLYSIASRYGADPELLRQSNGVPADGALAVGQTLVIQEVETFHIVQPGQTLSAIARAYGLSLRALYRSNYQLGGSPDILPGQKLVIAYAGEKLGSTYTNGYAYPFIQPPALRATLPYMSYLTPFTYGITAQGGLLPLNDEILLSEAAQLGTVPLMHLSTLTEYDGCSRARAVTVLTDQFVRAALLEEAAPTMAETG